MGTPVGEMHLEQIPKDLRQDNHRSYWAVFITIITIILAILFWYSQKIDILDIKTEEIPVVSEIPNNNTNPISSLETAASAIIIENYSENL
jgi:hypothetical protein